MLLISVDRVRLAAGLPPLCVQHEGDGPDAACVYARTILGDGPWRLVWRPHKPDVDDPLSTAWLEFDGDVTCEGGD